MPRRRRNHSGNYVAIRAGRGNEIRLVSLFSVCISLSLTKTHFHNHNNHFSVALKPGVVSMVRCGVQQALSLTRNDSTMSTHSRENSRKDNKNTQASR